jgi:diguanylate cyclase (GGDEF)-like protein
VAVLFLDLDRFKQINDTLGHTAGDRFLQAVAGRLEACLRRIDTVARQGGDEFVILLPGFQGSEAVTRVAEKLLAALSEPLALQGQVLHSSGSIGIALYPEDGRDVDTLLKHADVAMYRAKDAGRNTYCCYSATPEPEPTPARPVRMGVTEY